MVGAAGDLNVWIVGGGDLAVQFADAGLLDEVIVSIAPVTLGGGAPLLPRRIELRLDELGRNGDFACAVLRRAPTRLTSVGGVAVVLSVNSVQDAELDVRRERRLEDAGASQLHARAELAEQGSARSKDHRGDVDLQLVDQLRL